MFHWDRGLFLTAAGLAVDVQRRQPRGFISHAHADHIAPHELALCTPATARLYQHRRGAHRKTKEIPFREPLEFGPLRLTTFPPVIVWDRPCCWPRTASDRCCTPAITSWARPPRAQSAELPQADILVMESTFGRPRYRMPPREEVIGELVELGA